MQEIILLSKLVFLASQTLNLGSGSTWPGHIALNFNKNIVKEIIEKNKQLKVILIAGTNGKTTTATLLKFLLEKNGISTFQNKEGANLLNGIASTLICHADLSGKIHEDVAIFEVDENSLPVVLENIQPTALMLLNLFRDQLDRYGEVHTIAEKWRKALEKLPVFTKLIVNGDDPLLSHIGEQRKDTTFFGISTKLMKGKDLTHDVDSIYCPVCSSRLTYSTIAYSHLGAYTCPKCSFSRPTTITYSVDQKELHLKGIFNLYNISGVLRTLEEVFSLDLNALLPHLTQFKPAFGRQETLTYYGKKIKLILSKNPAGFNQSIQALSEFPEKDKQIMVLLNDRIPDGRDVSWIWDIDVEHLFTNTSRIIISGDRGFDMALRIKYAYDKEYSTEVINKHIYIYNTVTVVDSIKKAFPYVIDNLEHGKTLFVLANYSAMLEAREIIGGKKLQ